MNVDNSCCAPCEGRTFRACMIGVQVASLTLLVLAVLSIATVCPFPLPAGYVCAGIGAALVVPSTVLGCSCFETRNERTRHALQFFLFVIAATGMVMGGLGLNGVVSMPKHVGYLFTGFGSIAFLGGYLPTLYCTPLEK